MAIAPIPTRPDAPPPQPTDPWYVRWWWVIAIAFIVIATIIFVTMNESRPGKSLAPTTQETNR
jgi:hypothetical protein